eukprot:jgi/Tetstr1/449005/TSEL_036230.t1
MQDLAGSPSGSQRGAVLAGRSGAVRRAGAGQRLGGGIFLSGFQRGATARTPDGAGRSHAARSRRSEGAEADDERVPCGALDRQKRAGDIGTTPALVATQAVHPGDNVDEGGSPEPPAKKAKQPAKPAAGGPARGRDGAGARAGGGALVSQAGRRAAVAAASTREQQAGRRGVYYEYLTGATRPRLWRPRNDEADNYLTEANKTASRDEYSHLLCYGVYRAAAKAAATAALATLRAPDTPTQDRVDALDLLDAAHRTLEAVGDADEARLTYLRHFKAKKALTPEEQRSRTSASRSASRLRPTTNDQHASTTFKRQATEPDTDRDKARKEKDKAARERREQQRREADAKNRDKTGKTGDKTRD